MLKGNVANDGVCITVNSFYDTPNPDLSDLPERVQSFVAQSRAAHPFKQPEGIPASVCILASVLHNSPVPPEFWRTGVYNDVNSDSEA